MMDADALRERYEERAAILEYDAGMTRQDAERAARAMVYGSVDKREEK
jgi:hypothetical protein